MLVLTGQNLVDGIAAIVGQHVILKSDVAQLVQMTAMEQRLDPRTNTKELEQLQSRVIESLINQKLILEIAEVESPTLFASSPCNMPLFFRNSRMRWPICLCMQFHLSTASLLLT